MHAHFVFAPPLDRINAARLMGGTYPPTGLLYVAAYVRAHLPAVRCTFSDGVLDGLAHTVAEIVKLRPDVVLISCFTACAAGAYETGRQIKARLPHTVLVYGGPHPSALPHDPIRRGPADFSVFGEGEATALELLRALAASATSFDSIRGLCWRRGQDSVCNAPRAPIADIDEIPPPAIDLAPLERYGGWFLKRGHRDMVITSSRGCRNRCTFCSNAVFRRTLRLREPRSFVDEVTHYRERYGYNEFFDGSDQFNANLPQAHGICEELSRRGLKMPWKANVRATGLPEELVRAMAAAGCWYVQLGIESANERTLRGVGKPFRLADVERACALFRKHDIRVLGLFMLYNVWEEDGLPQVETTRDAWRTLRYAQDLYRRGLIQYMSWSFTMPWPGSPLYALACQHGLLPADLADDWRQWESQGKLLMTLPGVHPSAAALMHGLGAVQRGYLYLRSGNWNLRKLPELALRSLRAMGR
jgi:anaerobic magnesium-protoporphyrin IX monomethyl ester cyclase